MRTWVAALLGVLVSSSPAWSKGGLALAKREVPGATLLFPTGKVTRDEPSPDTGKLQIELVEGGRAQIGWMTGDPLSSDELSTTLISPLRKAMGLALAQLGPVRVGGATGTRWVLRKEKASMIVSAWSCGGREFHLIVSRGEEDSSELEASIRDSFVCKAGPARAGKTSPPKPSSAPAARARGASN